jgi:hypothetical protein
VWLRAGGILLSLFLLWAASHLAPAEQTLGVNSGLVYLHGAWVWSALLIYAAAAAAGLIGLAARQTHWPAWSRALGWTGLAFWTVSLPMSLAVMQVNWGGLFFAEPRWRIPFTFVVVGLLMQIGLALVNRSSLTCLANILFFGALAFGLSRAGNVLHPDSPIFHTSSLGIRAYFGLLVVLCLALVGQTAAFINERTS